MKVRESFPILVYIIRRGATHLNTKTRYGHDKEVWKWNDLIRGTLLVIRCSDIWQQLDEDIEDLDIIRANSTGAELMIYSNSAAQVRYSLNYLSRDALDQVRHFITKKVKVLNCMDLNAFLGPLKITDNDLDEIHIVVGEIWALK